MKLDKYTVGRRCGKALFELAIDSNQAEEIYQDLVSLRQIYEQVPGLGNMLSDVRLEPHKKREIMDKLINSYDGIIKSFLEIVYEYSRMDDLLFMVGECERRYDEHRGLLLGSVTTTIPLSNGQRIQLERNVVKITDYQSVELKQITDSSIIGGVIVETNHQIIDESTHTQLEKIRNQLYR